MIINPVEIVQSDSIWGEIQAGILIDAVGEQYRFLTDGTGVSVGKQSVDYKPLPGHRLVWVSETYRWRYR
jgi:hypothetical protein